MGFDEAVSTLSKRARDKAGLAVYFANVHTVTESTENPALAHAMQNALCLADGMPLVWVSRLFRSAIHSRVCGPDFMAKFLEKNRDLAHGFIGGAPGQAEKVAEIFHIESICDSPPMRPFSPENVRDDLNRFSRKLSGRPFPNMIWVGLGAPKQELWISEAIKLYPETLFLGVGAAFDFLAGTKPRAPRLMQKMGMEWLFRLLSEPKRLWRRYLKTNTLFIVKLFCQGNPNR